jgi:undecaprenyl-diphosphatase
MDEILRSAFIGIVQGITEFLPISSSAHLVLIPFLFGWEYGGLQFDVALHFGTVIALLACFWRDWSAIIASGIRNRQAGRYPKSLLWQIALATIPAALLGLFLEDKVEQYLHSPVLLAINLIVFGLLLWLVDIKTTKKLELDKLDYKKSLVVGLLQSLALVPGVSRSGITMIAGRGLGLTRENAARFSFLLGTPAMVGAFLLEARKLDFAALPASFWAGLAAATVAGFLAIQFLLAYLRKADFRVFAWYRIALAITVLAVFFLKG